MAVNKALYIFTAGLLASIQSALTTLETVWLKDVTTISQTDKRTFSDTDLPNELAFLLKRGSETRTLNLKRNHYINPNADFYFAQEFKDGQPRLIKSGSLKKEDLAYYQDYEKLAFMTVRCVKETNKQCVRTIASIIPGAKKTFVILDNTTLSDFGGMPEEGWTSSLCRRDQNGNIRIGDRTYDLRPAKNDVKSRNMLESPGHLDQLYVLKDESTVQRDKLAEWKRNNIYPSEATHINEEKAVEELNAVLRRFQGKLEDNRFHTSDADSQKTGKSLRQHKDEYLVKVAILLDEGIWDLFSSMVNILKPLEKRRKVMENIRKYFSHIMNGVNRLYKGIEDTSISIDVIITTFIVFKQKVFPYKASKATLFNNTKRIEAVDYLMDAKAWDKAEGKKRIPDVDHGMLFTRYNMYFDTPDNTGAVGFTHLGGVCKTGKRISIVEDRGLFWTVFTAAHELGHSLGACHDGEECAIACKASDYFIMSAKVADLNMTSSSNNPFVFSNCSVRSFKQTLMKRKCVLEHGEIYNIQEYQGYVQYEPGETYDLTEQCRFIIGRHSKFCETEPEDVCVKMRCTDPTTGKCMDKYHGAARGTTCGQNKILMKPFAKYLQ